MRLTPTLLLAVAACTPAAQPIPTPINAPLPAEASPPPPVFATVTTLAGEWRVAGIDGKEIDGSVGIALRADEREIWWEPRCAGYVRSYRIEGSNFTTGPYIGFKPHRPGDPPPIVCLIAPPPQMSAIFDVLTSATSISRTPNNGIEISGVGHSLLLFSQ
jgi:hypothetical protein